jgi:tetratricopeptide (TPR) repeat protein
VLLLSLVPLGLLFVITVTLARTYHVRQEGLARQWFQKGNTDLSGGQPRLAFEDFRNALSYNPENNLVQLRLAEALLADGRLTEARSYFANLWDRTPGSGEVNLDLAHLSQRTEDSEDAIRYFRSAIYGSWEKDPAQQRRNARLELCQYLIARGQDSDAEAELAALASDIPPEDVGLREGTGQLFLRVGEPGRALAEFEAALQTSPHDDKLLEDAGRAAYAAGDYPKAETYLARAVRENSSDEIVGLLDTVREVLAADPFQPGLSDEERARRSWDDFRQALESLQKCLGTGATNQATGQTPSNFDILNKDAQDMKRRANFVSLRRNPELRDEVMQFSFRVEGTTSQSCSTPSSRDRALLLISKKHSGSNP